MVWVLHTSKGGGHPVRDGEAVPCGVPPAHLPPKPPRTTTRPRPHDHAHTPTPTRRTLLFSIRNWEPWFPVVGFSSILCSNPNRDHSRKICVLQVEGDSKNGRPKTYLVFVRAVPRLSDPSSHTRLGTLWSHGAYNVEILSRRNHLQLSI
jgi:hypothetical protein